MDIKEKFNREFGTAFIIEDKSKYPDYCICVGASTCCALIDNDIAQFDFKWKGFKPRMSLLEEKYGIIRYDKETAYQFFFVRKAVEILKPNEYALPKRYSKEVNDEVYVFLLKNNKYVIGISPIISINEKDYPYFWKVIEWEDFIMKTAKSVFVL